MEFKDIFVFTILTGLIIFGTLMFASQFATDNNLQTNVNQNPYVNKIIKNVTYDLNKSQIETDAKRKALIDEESHPISTALGFAFTSVLSALNTFTDMGLNFIFYSFDFAGEIFNINPIFFTAIMGILIGIIVLAIWSVVRAGR